MTVPTATSVSSKKRRCPDHVDGADADRGDVVLGSQPAAVLDERVVELGAQQRMIDRLRDVALGQGVEIDRHLSIVT